MRVACFLFHIKVNGSFILHPAGLSAKRHRPLPSGYGRILLAPIALYSTLPLNSRHMRTLTANQLPLAPLGAGDLIDRAVRLYRRHFMTLIRIAAPPVIISAIGSVVMTLAWRKLWATSESAELFIYSLLVGAGFIVWGSGNLMNMVVMGGATRNLVMHLLWSEPVSARSTYSAVRSRFWGLLFATLVVAICVSICAFIALVAWYIVFLVTMLAAFAFSQIAGWLAALVGILGFIIATVAGLWVFFLLAGNFAYVPQVMLVEGKGIFESISRSMSLARGNVRRLMAIVFFCSFATYSALMILIIPLGWYGYLHGIDPSPWLEADWPIWYAIGYNVLWQSSLILLAPVWMLALSLLYVDERVRHEGYDIELMAARRLGEMPHLSGGHISPFAPALVTGRQTPVAVAPPPRFRPDSTLGLR
ncbi:MAG TPA: hypothetical protein VGB17_11015 [Pyrinomonadaceae bacterium]